VRLLATAKLEPIAPCSAEERRLHDLCLTLIYNALETSWSGFWCECVTGHQIFSSISCNLSPTATICGLLLQEQQLLLHCCRSTQLLLR
jgi:hypothetical protein